MLPCAVPPAAAAFALAFLGYEARTGLNPTQNVADIVKIWCAWLLRLGGRRRAKAGAPAGMHVMLVPAPKDVAGTQKRDAAAAMICSWLMACRHLHGAHSPAVVPLFLAASLSAASPPHLLPPLPAVS